MRKPIIAGNWKMFKLKGDALAFVEAVKNSVPAVDKADSIVCAPFVFLDALVDATKGSNLGVAAQNMHFEEEGAFTGEVAPRMLADLGVNAVVIGHSERREMFNETDETVNKKVHAAFKHNLLPIVCVGESLEVRENGSTNDVVDAQTVKALAGLTADQVAGTVIAYEPIWAIGTGKTATSEQANETCGYIRSVVAREYGQATADAIRIQYGGSVKPDNVVELMAQSDIDGALVGGASLDPESFLALLDAVK